MSRAVTLVKVTVRMTGRWAVGTIPLPGSEIDLPVMVDPRSPTAIGHRPFVPGGSLAGSLRAHLGDDAVGVLGPEPPEWEQSSPAGRMASPLAVRGTIVLDGLEIVDRQSTSVNRHSGAADNHTLRAEQWVAPGRFVIAMDLDSAAPATMARQLATWRPTLGRGRSTGLGQGVVEKVETLELNLDDASHLTWWLTRRYDWYAADTETPTEVSVVESSETDRARSTEAHQMSVSLRVSEPVRVGTGGNEVQKDGRRALEVLRQRSRVLIPGSTWKGLFRNRVATILTLVAAPTESAAVDQIVTALFGSTKNGRGMLGFSDSLAAVGAKEITRTHVAIDRFTGGVIDGGLYRVKALDVGEALTLTVSGATVSAEVANLVRHVLRDLHDGLISVGGMGTRGYGRVQVTTSGHLGELRPVSISRLLEAITKGSNEGGHHADA